MASFRSIKGIVLPLSIHTPSLLHQSSAIGTHGVSNLSLPSLSLRPTHTHMRLLALLQTGIYIPSVFFPFCLFATNVPGRTSLSLRLFGYSLHSFDRKTVHSSSVNHTPSFSGIQENLFFQNHCPLGAYLLSLTPFQSFNLII